MTSKATLDIFWDGPFSWPELEGANFLQAVPRTPSVYLQTFGYQGGYLIYTTELSRRPIFMRFKEHTRKYMNGEYTVLDVYAAQRGIR